MQMRRLWSPTTSGRSVEGTASDVDLSSVLVAHVVGEVDGGLAVAEVADRLGVAAATASRLCDRAVAAGYLEKVVPAGDARRRTVSLTAAGVRLREDSLAFRLDYLGDLLRGWTPDEIATFERLLSRFAMSVVDNPPRPRPSRTTQGEDR